MAILGSFVNSETGHSEEQFWALLLTVKHFGKTPGVKLHRVNDDLNPLDRPPFWRTQVVCDFRNILIMASRERV
jgi:hypothetical protein